jgi:Mrp family chromosome partitioning ATPase
VGVRQQVEAAKDLADWVVVHAPPVLEGAAALQAAGGADDVILVARLGRTNRREYGRALTMLERAGAPLTGLVVMASGSRRRPRSRGGASRPTSIVPTETPVVPRAASERRSVHR